VLKNAHTNPAKIAAILVISHSGELKPRIPTLRNGSNRNCSHKITKQQGLASTSC